MHYIKPLNFCIYILVPKKYEHTMMLIFVKGSWCNRKTRNWKDFIQISMIVNLKSLKPGTGIDIEVVSFTKITM